MGFYIILGLIVVVGLWIVLTYNGLVSRRNQVENAWSDIDVQLKRRYDLVPNLVESVKGYVKQEKGVLEAVTEARAQAMHTSGKLDDQSKAENGLTAALKTVFAVAESYPDLKSSENFQQLSSELPDIEDKIQAARRFFNAYVQDFNTKVETIPTNIVAKSMGFTRKEMFDLDDNAEQRESVKVQF